MSPEHSWVPSPPVAGCRPASTSAWDVCTRHAMPEPSTSPSALSVTTADSGSSLYCDLSGPWVSASFDLSMAADPASVVPVRHPVVTDWRTRRGRQAATAAAPTRENAIAIGRASFQPATSPAAPPPSEGRVATTATTVVPIAEPT